MAAELLFFLGGTLIILIPGIWLAGIFSLGETRLERWTTGSSLGLALAIYLAAVLSHIDLRWFYPLWGIVALVCFAMRIKSKPLITQSGGDVQIWMIVVLLLVGLSRFATALPRVLPEGTLDPTFHLVLAKQIQITHHAIDSWPFANIPLNYPTGSHIFLVVLAGLCRLPLHTTFKDLIPFLGVLTTAQIFVFGKRVTGNATMALYSAAIYGLWAWFGSIDYFRWGGVPNELAMLLFMAMLSIDGASRGKVFAMTICFASMVLVHHHVMVVGAAILALIILWEIVRCGIWRPLAIALVLGFIIDSFFLLPYTMHLTNFHSTGMVVAGEPLLPLGDLPQSFGYALICFAAIGIVLCLTRKMRCHPIVGIASLSLIGMFVVGEDLIPMALRAMNRTAFTFFTPSRFLTDLNYFLPVFASMAIFYFQQRLKFPRFLAMLVVLVAAILDYQQWVRLFNDPGLPLPVIDACDWIQHNTPKDTIVDNTGAWMTYLCWREPAQIALPVSEPVADYHPAAERIPQIVAGKMAPSSPEMIIVRIGDARDTGGRPILWQDAQGAAVIKEWP